MSRHDALWRDFLGDGRRLVESCNPLEVSGRLTRINGLVMEASGIKLPLGSGCRILVPGGGAVEAEVVGFNGDMNTGLTLRTVRIKDGIAEVRAGATLLNDSDPQEEEAETELKASAMIAAIRVRTATGLSNLMTFTVGPLPEVKEVEPNSEFQQPQAVPLNVTVTVPPNDDSIKAIVLLRLNTAKPSLLGSHSSRGVSSGAIGAGSTSRVTGAIIEQPVTTFSTLAYIVAFGDRYGEVR